MMPYLVSAMRSVHLRTWHQTVSQLHALPPRAPRLYFDGRIGEDGTTSTKSNPWDKEWPKQTFQLLECFKGRPMRTWNTSRKSSTTSTTVQPKQCFLKPIHISPSLPRRPTFPKPPAPPVLTESGGETNSSGPWAKVQVSPCIADSDGRSYEALGLILKIEQKSVWFGPVWSWQLDI